MKRNSVVSELKAKKTDYDIPTFGFKSAFFILLGAVTGTIICPMILGIFGVSMNFGILVGNTFITSFAVNYSRFFIESKRGYCKAFWMNYAFFGFSFGVITYLWRYLNFFI
ncbi:MULTISPECIES: hypothetical protein [unclassified Clostridium]|uniref:hypothetical protein n=1 Tax=unclassified Clostridium TaxID=2614128 RepID=UPI0018976C67|nr:MULTISPECIES: hypothetical protein [unclassified Clostridium]MCR1950594.1 hypothetical protein [Clostridium sp. DSM 100503]